MSIIKNVHFDQLLFLNKLWNKSDLLLKSKFNMHQKNDNVELQQTVLVE